MTLNEINAAAITPDQLLPYVNSVSGLKSRTCGDCALHYIETYAVLVAYPCADPYDSGRINKAVEEACKLSHIKNLTVLAAERPDQAPADATSRMDQYWFVNLPVKPSQKVRNMLTSAARRLKIAQESWGPDHDALRNQFLKTKSLDVASSYIYNQLGAYLGASPDATLFCARDGEGRLHGLAIGDFSSLSTAFYMFAMRTPDALPGTADLLLHKIINTAGDKGYTKLNLGLGINDGVEFFKKKWGATPDLPYVETSWKIKKPGFFARIFRS